MSNASDKRVDLKMRIIEGTISLNEVKKEIHQMEEEFGEDAFLPYHIDKKEKPWDEEYLDELERLSVAGAGSKEFILHLSEVKEDIKNKKRRKKTNLCLIAGSVAIAMGIIGIVVWLCNR